MVLLQVELIFSSGQCDGTGDHTVGVHKVQSDDVKGEGGGFVFSSHVQLLLSGAVLRCVPHLTRTRTHTHTVVAAFHRLSADAHDEAGVDTELHRDA